MNDYVEVDSESEMIVGKEKKKTLKTGVEAIDQPVNIIKMPAKINQEHRQHACHPISKKGANQQTNENQPGNSPNLFLPGISQCQSLLEKRYPAPRTV